MKISVVGCGYLGAVHAASMAELGHDVVGIDVDLPKVEALQLGKAPFYEPGFDDLLAAVAGVGPAARSAPTSPAAADAQVHFVCVGTPQKRGEYAADLRYVEAAVQSLLLVLRPGSPGRREVDGAGGDGRAAGRAGRSRRCPGRCWRGTRSSSARGSPSQDTLHPDRLVYGLPEGDDAEKAHALLDEVYAPIVADGTPKVVTDYATAEMVKTAANSFLATKISFINAMAELCEATGADVKQLADAIGYDDRIGRKFLNAGLGFGGGCLPKDIRAFMARAGELGADQALTFLREVDNINMRRRIRMVELAREVCDGSAARQADRRARCGVQAEQRRHPRLAGAERRRAAAAAGRDGAGDGPGGGGELPPDVAAAGLRGLAPRRRRSGRTLVLLLTEWKQYRELDPVAFGRVVSQRRVLDGRNALDRARWEAAGWSYRALGRRNTP